MKPPNRQKSRESSPELVLISLKDYEDSNCKLQMKSTDSNDFTVHLFHICLDYSLVTKNIAVLFASRTVETEKLTLQGKCGTSILVMLFSFL